MKNRIAALSLTLALSVGLCAPAHAAETTFSDVPADHWAASSIARMEEAGVMSGVGNGLFAPDKTLSSAEFITMMVRQFYEDQIGTGGGAWYAPYVEAAQAADILDGTKAGTDASMMEAPIDRYDMAQVMYNVIRDQGMEAAPLADTSMVADWSAVPAGYQDAVSVCYNAGMLSGVDGEGTFNGNGEMTRAQGAVVMDRLIYVEIPPTGEIPAGAKTITEMSQLTCDIGATAYPGGFYLNPNSVMYGGSTLGINSMGYSRLTLTFRAAEVDTRVKCSVTLQDASYTDPTEPRGEYVVPVGETMNLSFDCSGSRNVGLYITDDSNGASFAEGWITNIYLTK